MCQFIDGALAKEMRLCLKKRKVKVNMQNKEFYFELNLI